MKKHQKLAIDQTILIKVDKHIRNRMSQATVRAGRSVIKEYESTIALMVNRPDWQFNLRQLISRSVDIIDREISKQEDPRCIARLTTVSIKIGRAIVDYDKEVSTKTLIRIGDIFIDGLFVNGLLRISQPGAFYKDLSWFVAWTDKGLKAKTDDLSDQNSVLRDTDYYPMLDTDSMLREYAGRKSVVIKRSGAKQPVDTSSDHIKALDKLQQQSWMVNNEVLSAVKDNAAAFHSDNASKKIAFEAIIKKADKAYEYGRFYQGHDIDYRGRFYVMEPFFSFQGQDVARGLFLFADGVEITDDGWFWLFIHTANCFNQSYNINDIPDWCQEDYKLHLEINEQDSISVDKMSLNDRMTWTQTNLNHIRELGRTKQFWRSRNETGDNVFAAEKPVSFLAACIEINKLASDPDALTHLPISVDGSNNGWQHLVAMAKDHTAAHLVGMSAIDIPEDFYLSTGRALLTRLSQSINTQDVELYEILKKIPMRDIRKGISKRGSMTRAYSAGAKAIATNMWQDCKHDGFEYKYFNMDKLIDEALNNGMAQSLLSSNSHPEINNLQDAAKHVAETTCYGYCNLAAKHLVKAITDVCPGPLASMNYFMKLAQYEVGIYKWFTDKNEPAEKRRKVLKARRKELIMIDSSIEKGGMGRLMTDGEMDELNLISKELMSFKYKLTKGNGNTAITWTTPSGFKVCSQHFTKYRDSVNGQITDVRKSYKGVPKSHINHMFWTMSKNAAIQDTISAISPNIVHSYDAAHLAIAVANWNGAIGVIHDSYSTHASHVPVLIDLIKDVFVDMYKNKDIFGKLKKEILADDTDFDFDPPAIGDLDFDGVYNSDFFFS